MTLPQHAVRFFHRLLAASLGALPTLADTTATTTPLGLQFDATSAIFRVWAPFATTVHVAGTFNGWNPADTPLHPEGNGNWFVNTTGISTGTEYKYVIVNGTQTLWRTDPLAQCVETNNGNSVAYAPDAFPWTDKTFTSTNADRMVIYEMHVGTFNDPNPADRIVGTFATAMERIPYLASLGINMLKVLPVAEFPNNYSWGYNPAMHAAVESAYGGPDGFKTFVNACHALGIGVILDVVHNHWDAGKVSLWRFDGWSENGKGGIYFYQDGRSDTPWGPRPDYGRPEVRAYIWQTIEQWLTQYHVNGLRWDATAFIRNQFGNENDPANDIADGWRLLQTANDQIDALPASIISIAEDLRNNAALTRPTRDGGGGFDSQWNGAFVDWVRPSLETGEDLLRNMSAVREALTRLPNSNAFERVIYTESHDAVANGSQRVPSKIDPANPGSYWARKRSTLGAALLLTAPGIPMLFQGQEFLEDGTFSDNDPLDWSKTNTCAGIHLLYHDLIRLRVNAANTSRGLAGQHINVHHVNDADKVIAFHRWQNGGPGDDTIVIANFANRTWQTNEQYRVGLPRTGTWLVRCNTDLQSYSADFGNTGPTQVEAEPTPWNNMPHSAMFTLPPYSALILSQ